MGDAGRDCDYAGPCETKADCAKPCRMKNRDPNNVLCIPDPVGGGGCCCCVLS